MVRVVTVAGLVLAAGAGRRFGGAKAIAVLDGERLVDRAVRTLREAGLEQVYVVAGAEPLDVPGAVVVDNPGWAEGIGSSLRAGLAALDTLPPDVAGAMVVPVDQPGLTGEAVRRVLGAVTGRDTLAAASYEGRQGHPVLLGRAYWAAVTGSAVGDVGAREFLRRNRSRVVLVECADAGSGDDADTRDDLERLRPAKAGEPQLHDQRGDSDG